MRPYKDSLPSWGTQQAHQPLRNMAVQLTWGLNQIKGEPSMADPIEDGRSIH